MLDLNLDYKPHLPAKIDYKIGCIGAGFIMRDVQLVAYAKAGFNVVAIASRSAAHAQSTATIRGISTVHETWQELLDDKRIEIVDIAFPPDQQPEIIREATRRKHIKGILAQKPLAMNYAAAKVVVDACETAGVHLCVNQNMRYDQAMRALKSILDSGMLGAPVLATIEMRIHAQWQSFCADYERLILLNLSIHHLDVYRFLFGEPQRVWVSARTDPGDPARRPDGIALYVLEYSDGLRAAAWDDTWGGGACGAPREHYIRWRVEGTKGMARGTIGWPKFGDGDSQSTLTFTSDQQPGVWIEPRWEECWFPDAFVGPMAELMQAIQTGNPAPLSGRDNLGTIALVEAAYHSLQTQRSVAPAEVIA